MHKIRLIDRQSEDTGILADMEYTYSEEGVVKLQSLSVHNIVDGTVSKSIEVPVMVKLGFAAYLLKVIEQQDSSEDV